MLKLRNFYWRLETFVQLGFRNLLRVAIYRICKRTGILNILIGRGLAPNGPFFNKSERTGVIPNSNLSWNESLWWFGFHKKQSPQRPPDWFSGPFNKNNSFFPLKSWTDIDDFSHGDIKEIWELSRFDWVVAWSTQVANGDQEKLDKLNTWIANWSKCNPPYLGPNWKCGQETSIRVLHCVLSLMVLGQDAKPEQGMIDFISTHLQRIEPTISYALAQQNNHGTSEAAALFVGGSLLERYDDRGSRWKSLGRKVLEECAEVLIQQDGTFSQYSVNYHRLVLDTYSFVEAWRRYRGLREFSSELITKLAAATRWLNLMVNDENGNVPNIGANDGAKIIPLVDYDYRDYRISVQLAAAIFENREVYGDGIWNDALSWLMIERGKYKVKLDGRSFDDGGYHVLKSDKCLAVMRYPRFRFRPSQADALHIDFRIDDRNILRDAGSYSYNSTPDLSRYFNGTASHNTVEFDGRDQMPRLSRFLFGSWLKTKSHKPVKISKSNVSCSASYVDYKGAKHKRTIFLENHKLLIKDEVQGFKNKAILRWRLPHILWNLRQLSNSVQVKNEDIVISVTSDIDIIRAEITKGLESLYYMEKNDIQVLECEVNKCGTLQTEITW